MSFLLNPHRFKAPSEWTLRQSKAAQQDSYSIGSQFLAATFDSAPLENSLILAAFGSNDVSHNNPASAPGFSAAFAIAAASDPNTCGLLYKVSGASEGSTITLDFGSSTRVDHSVLFIMEWTGNATGSPLDGTPATNDESASSGLVASTGSMTTGLVGSLLVAVHTYSEGGYIGASWSNFFVQRHFYQAELTGPDMSLAVATRTAGAAGSYSTACTMISGPGASRASGLAAFKLAA